MRTWEVDDPLASRPQVRVPNEVIRELYNQYRDHPAMPQGADALDRILSAPGYEQLELMFRLRARDFYGRVRLIKDPKPLLQFRLWIHERYVMGYCGRCHAGQETGDFGFYRRQKNTDRTFYSNFYILDQYENDAGQMINRPEPAKSLLLQYGLPRDTAETPHPPAENWRPHFLQRENDEFESYVQIIDELYNKPQYQLTTELPGVTDSAATTQPGAAPTNQPSPDGTPQTTPSARSTPDPARPSKEDPPTFPEEVERR
jgi:hypothetical protein